ncbi:MAG: tRNA pseudouridine(55) synthase TruB [Firmicutes bacterium]|nr:tRNA pseudouridine(55) synthase TruB [Bacillota bacterium]
MSDSGFLVLDKPPGYTSHQVVAAVRKILAERRIGHTGTLDPMARGVLVLAVGMATKLIPYLDEERKVYRARLVLGLTTDTQDLTGRVLSAHPEIRISREQLASALICFTGEQEQIPPMYSALKVKGEPLYKLARAGKEISRAKRKITIYRLEAAETLLPAYGYQEGPHLLIECSRGTYIRTLCHDLGAYLGCGGCMGELLRLASGPFRLADACSLEELARAAKEGKAGQFLLSPVDALSHLPMLHLSEESGEKVRHGGQLQIGDFTRPPGPEAYRPGQLARGVDDDGRLLAILKYIGGSSSSWQPVRVLAR